MMYIHSPPVSDKTFKKTYCLVQDFNPGPSAQVNITQQQRNAFDQIKHSHRMSTDQIKHSHRMSTDIGLHQSQHIVRLHFESDT
jgi:hypothetical protein